MVGDGPLEELCGDVGLGRVRGGPRRLVGLGVGDQVPGDELVRVLDLARVGVWDDDEVVVRDGAVLLRGLREEHGQLAPRLGADAVEVCGGKKESFI